MAGFACARRPVHKIIPYVVKPEEITPGVSNWYASTDPETGYGVLVKTREGRPIKLEGNPDHPLNRGKLSARGQAAVLDLYDPDRLKAPLQRSKGGAGKAITWAEADQAVVAKLKAAGSKVRVLSGPMGSDTTRKLVGEFLGGNAASHVEFDPLALDEIAEGQLESYGTAVMPHYRFDRADLIVSFGADFLGTWPNAVGYAADFMSRRRLLDEKHAATRMSQLVTFESTMTLTGSNSDERHPLRPGDEVRAALAIAHELIVNQKRSRFATDSAVTSALSGYKPETIAGETGIAGSVFKKLAQALWAARGKGMVLAGSHAERAIGGLRRLQTSLLTASPHSHRIADRRQ
jgi:molybdopterin-containing oxidoreductase family iron-sulfur binding subunit